MYYDFQAIKKNVPIETVLDLFGEKYRKLGKFRCISKKHTDRTSSMMINHKNNTCHCFGCNNTFNSLSLTAEELGCSIYEAAKYLVNQLGLDKDVYAFPSEYEDELEEDPFPYTCEELGFIGLKMNYFFSSFSTDADFKVFMDIHEDAMQAVADGDISLEQAGKEIKAKEAYCMNSEYHHKDIHFSMKQFFREDPEGFYFLCNSMISNRTDEAERRKAILKELYKKEKKEFLASGNKETRNKVANHFIQIMKDPFSTTAKEYETLLLPENYKILEKYYPLNETHKMLAKADKEIELLEEIGQSIPKKHRMDETIKDI